MSAAREAVLESWARRDAAMSIAAENNLTAKAVRKIVERARQNSDPRAIYRIGERAGTAPQAKAAPAPLHRVMGISTRTVFATVLGIGSVGCRRIAVSVSCLPTEREV